MELEVTTMQRRPRSSLSALYLKPCSRYKLRLVLCGPSNLGQHTMTTKFISHWVPLTFWFYATSELILVNYPFPDRNFLLKIFILNGRSQMLFIFLFNFCTIFQVMSSCSILTLTLPETVWVRVGFLCFFISVHVWFLRQFVSSKFFFSFDR